MAKTAKTETKNATNISFETWVTKFARGRGEAAALEIAKLKAKFPAYKNAGMYEKNFPIAYARFQAFLKRGSMAGKRPSRAAA